MTSTALEGLAGATVKDPQGNKIGKVVDVYESTDGQVDGTFVTVSTGLFGGSASFVPLAESRRDGDDLVVPYDKDLVKDAPRVENDEELTAPEEERLYRHYSLSASAPATEPATEPASPPAPVAADQGAGHDTSGPNTDDAMTRSEQHLVAGTTTQEAGRARLRKRIVTDTETVTVPVSKEQVTLTSEPITDANRGDATSGAELSEEEHEVVLHEERPVVSTETVPVERVRLGTETVTGTETVSGEVGREVIEVEDGTDKTS